MKPHPTEKMLEQLLFSLDEEQVVMFAHLVGCETCRKTLAELPPERREPYGPPVKTAHREPAELIAFPRDETRDENGRPQPAQPRRKGAARKSLYHALFPPRR